MHDSGLVDELFRFVDFGDKKNHLLRWEHFHKLVVFLKLTHRHAPELFKIEVDKACLVELWILFHYNGLLRPPIADPAGFEQSFWLNVISIVVKIILLDAVDPT
jgi:hypothetical protein